MLALLSMHFRLSHARLMPLRRSALALAVAVLAWTAGCATVVKPAIEPTFAARTYTPIRIALLPPDVFMVLDQVGDNDRAKSEALRQAVFNNLVKFSAEAFRQRGYELDFSARWDGVVDRSGQLLVNRDELAVMANSILQFVNAPAGGTKGPLTTPEIIAPDLAAKIGWATQSDALLYVNLKGVTTSNGKRTGQVVGTVLFVVVIALIVLAILADSKGGGGGRGGGTPGVATGAGQALAGPVTRGGLPGGGGGGGLPTGPGVGGIGGIGGPRGVPPVGRGGRSFVGGGGPGRVYGGGPRVGVHMGVMIPLDGPGYTHEGQVGHQDEWFGGDQMYLSMTLVNASDGRVLWHLKDELDLDAEDPKDVQEMVNRVVRSLPLRGDLTAPVPTAPAK